MHFSINICCVIREGVITVGKCVHRGASACREHHTLSLVQNKHLFLTILNFVWRSRLADAPWCVHFSIDICCVIQEGVRTVGKCMHGSVSARRERHSFCLDKMYMEQTSMHIPVIKIASQKYNKTIIG